MSDFLSVCFSIVIIFSEQFIFFVLWNSLLQLKKKKWWVYIFIFSMLVCVTFVTNMFINNANIKLIIYFGLLFGILRLFYTNKWYVLLLLAAVGIVYLKVIDNIIIYTSAFLLGVKLNLIIENPYSFVLLAFISKTIEFMGAWCFSRVFRKRYRNQPTYWQSWVLTLPLPVAACFFLSVALQLSLTQPEMTPLLLILGLAFLCLCAIQIFIAYRLDKQQQNEIDNKMLQQTLERQKENLQSLTEAYIIHRQLTHEFNNNLEIISSLAQQAPLQELLNYLEKLHQKSQIATFIIHTGNAVLDAVLNHKYHIANTYGVTLALDMANFKHPSLRNDEIAVVVSNLLDNAIEACAKYEGNRVINLKMKINDNQLLIKVTNPTINPPRIIDGHWISSKENSLLHGFGMINIENILNSLGADYTSEFVNEKFSFVAFIPL